MIKTTLSIFNTFVYKQMSCLTKLKILEIWSELYIQYYNKISSELLEIKLYIVSNVTSSGLALAGSVLMADRS